MNTIEKPCVVCDEPVLVQEDADMDPLCIEHFFTDDPTEEWEADE